MTSYWILAVLVVSLMLMGLDYSFGDALFLGVLLVPGCLASRWLIPKIKSGKKHIRVIASENSVRRAFIDLSGAKLDRCILLVNSELYAM